MTAAIYRYSFTPGVPLDEVRYSLLLSALAAEGVHGQSEVRLEAGYHLDEAARACVVDATTPVGMTISRIFTGLLTREFGESAFGVERLDVAAPGGTRER